MSQAALAHVPGVGELAIHSWLGWSGLRALWKYIGVKMPSRPAATRLSAATLRSSPISNDPSGTARTRSRTRSAAEVIFRPSVVLGKPLRVRPPPSSGRYHGWSTSSPTARSCASTTSNPAACRLPVTSVKEAICGSALPYSIRCLSSGVPVVAVVRRSHAPLEAGEDGARPQDTEHLGVGGHLVRRMRKGLRYGRPHRRSGAPPGWP